MPHCPWGESQNLDFWEMLVQACVHPLCIILSWGSLWDRPHPTPSHPMMGMMGALYLHLGITSFQRENLLKGQKEEEERLLQAIPLFCFPDGNNWAAVTEFTRYLPHCRVWAGTPTPVGLLRAGRTSSAQPIPAHPIPTQPVFSLLAAKPFLLSSPMWMAAGRSATAGGCW